MGIIVNKSPKPVLSILVISHNQKDLLPRCLDSVLCQKLSVSYEVIVSDDRSTDGTWELIQEYEKRYPNIVKGVKCNSDLCNPSTRSERCGWNKATVYKHSQGDFFVNIDADDYLRSDDIYQHQLDLLMDNPTCSMCQQRIWQVTDGKPIETGYAWPVHPKLKEGAILTPAEAILNEIYGLNPTYMIRRSRTENPAEKYGRLYDDTIITLYHMQYGNIVFTDRADYVWVQYSNSISNSDKGDERELLYAILPYQHALLIPKFADLFMSVANLPLLHTLKKSLLGKIELQQNTIQYLTQFEGFIFQYYAKGQKGLKNRIRLARSLILYRQIRKGKKTDERARNKLYQLLIGDKTNRKDENSYV
jgi:glycosyltransferase involved in cell wall biosynthesis